MTNQTNTCSTKKNQSAASVFGLAIDKVSGQFVPQFDGEHFHLPAVKGIARALKRDLERIRSDIWSVTFLLAFARSVDADANPKLANDIRELLDDAAGGARAIRDFFDGREDA